MQTTHNWARADFMVVNTKTCQVETSKFIYVHFIQAGDKNNKFNWIDFKCVKIIQMVTQACKRFKILTWIADA